MIKEPLSIIVCVAVIYSIVVITSMWMAYFQHPIWGIAAAFATVYALIGMDTLLKLRGE